MYQRYLFFKNQAGGVGRIDANGRVAWEHARVGLDLARAEALAERAEEVGVLSIEWVDDDMPYDPGDACTDEEAREKFESNEWTGPYGCILRVDGDPIESLWGIVVGPRGTADPYCRVVAAELALESSDDIRQALGDALDSAIPCPLI